MNEPEDVTTDLAASTPTKSRQLSRIVLIVIVMVTAAAAAAGYALRSQQEVTPPASSAAQLASVQIGCDDWAASTAPSSPSDAWCSGMVGWMSDRMGGAMMGSGMWSGPEQLRASCRQWADDSPDQSGNPSAGLAASTCAEMVAWMDGHTAGGWGMWTMHDR